jgi:hypothetical protein
MSSSDVHLLPKLRQTFGGHSFKHDSKMEITVTRRLIKKDRTDINREQKSSYHDIINASTVLSTMGKSSWIAVQLNVKSSY